MSVTAALHIEHPDSILAFAGDELRHFLAEGFGVAFAEAAAWHFMLKHDRTLPPFAFAIDAQNQQVTLTGQDSSGVLHAVYTLLEHLGYCFEITGARRIEAQENLVERLNTCSTRIQPKVNWRGIRQHLNFPMDISGYALPDALDYIRNLARLRLNHITFHSYPDQWYEVNYPDGRQMLAGGYFYGQRHDIPDNPVLKRVIQNQRTFCIPEHEPFIDDAGENSRRAIGWLQAVMDEAKRVGLRVQFSFELREQHLPDSLATVAAILQTYPQIDVLEIITQESGEWGHAAPADELKHIAAEYFGADVLNDETITRHLIDGQKDLHRLLREIGHAIQVFKHLIDPGHAKAAPAIKIRNLPELALGVYCTVRSDHAVILALLQKYTPPGVNFALLLDHGNRAVAQNLRDLNMPRAGWHRSMIYSWIEFDGTMYLFQNALTGIYQLMTLAQEVCGSEPVHAISLNHWRTAENQTCARYAAEVLLKGAIPPDKFYQDYAASYGITAKPDAPRYDDAVSRYIRAMTTIDDADTRARDTLPNVGFCYVGCWGVTGLGYYGVFKAEHLREVHLGMYDRALNWLKACERDTPLADGTAYLALLINRVECTCIYLKALELAVMLQTLCTDKTPEQLTDEERKQVRHICDMALARMDEMMALHAAQITDRGCEGTLISFYYTPPAVLKRIRAEYGGEGDFTASSASDAPPAPIWSGE
jgi:hypothetical protein